ncbi:MAG TPA: CDP-diacylglycerol diphosphatase [Desulfuromonadaceae bacterium]
MKGVNGLVRRIIPLMVHVAACGMLLATTPCLGADHRDILWNTVSTCIDTTVKDYCAHCTAPRVEVDCRTCRNTTQVWAESKEFVAIRDRKMCDCPDGFVHGLAIPRSRVTGVEDPARPDGIWRFAWEAALKRMDANEVALVVNPKGERSQDQLHVHIVRVRRESLPSDPLRTAHVRSLDRVWYAAARKAAELDWKDYGVLVARDTEGAYLVVVDNASPEHKFTRAECR